MRDTSPFSLTTAASTRSQQTRAFVRSRLLQFQSGPVCSCHPDGGHPGHETDFRDTVRLRRKAS